MRTLLIPLALVASPVTAAWTLTTVCLFNECGQAHRTAAVLVAQVTGAGQGDEKAQRGKAQAEYRSAIRQAIVRHWDRRKSVTREMRCDVLVEQNPAGTIASVDTLNCTGDEAFRQSVEAAVWKASPLPLPPDPLLFDRHLRFTLQAR